MRQLLAERGMTQSEAARRLGYPTAEGFAKILRTSNPQLKKMQEIVDGLGIPLIEVICRMESLPIPSDDVFTVPYVSAGDVANFVDNPVDLLSKATRYPVAKTAFQGEPAQHPDEYVALEVVGSNMAPNLPARSVVLAKSVSVDKLDKLSQGIYAILTPEELRLGETAGSDSDDLVLNSTNGRYGTIHLSKDEVKFVAKVVGSLERSV